MRFEALEDRQLLTVTASSTPPAINGADIANLGTPGPMAGAFDPANTGCCGGGDGGHIWSNRPIQGQTFTTGSHAGGYELRAVTLQNEENTVTNNTAGFTVRVGTISGNTFTQVRSEFANNPVSYVPNNFITFTFSQPVLLSPNTVYGFEWDASGSGFTTYNNADTLYTGGQGYSSGGGGVPNDSALVFRGIDRVFHVDLTEAGPPASLRVTGADPADGRTLTASPATMTLDFNTTVDAATVDAADLQIDGASAVGVSIVDADTLQFELPVNLAFGAHSASISAGALSGVGGIAFDGFASSFTIVEVADASISINFEGRTAGPSVRVAPDGVAGVTPTSDWNNIDGTTNVSGVFGPFVVTGNNGETANVSWAATGTWSSTNTGTRTLPVTNNDANMMDGHIEGTGTGQASATVTGLADDFAQYDVYVYVGDDAGNRVGEIRFNGGPIQTFTSKVFDGTYTLGTDYFLFEDVTGDSFIVTVEPLNDDGANRTGIRGIQIIANDVMRVEGVTPADGETLGAAPSTIRVDFSQTVILASLDAADLTVDGNPATGVTPIDGDTLEFTIAGTLAAGNHTIAIAEGALLGEGDLAVQAFQSTFTVATAPTIENIDPPAVIEAVQAELGGVVTDTGFDAPDATLYWGTSDGGTNPAAWASSVDLGTQAGAFSHTVVGLDPNTTYFFRTAATNVAGTAWAAATSTFTTEVVMPPSLALLPASSITSASARLVGEVTDTGGQPPVVTFYYGDNDPGAGNPAAWDHFVTLGAREGLFSTVISGLTAQTTYHFRARGTNDAGDVWTAAGSFTTSAFVPATVVINELHYDPDVSTDLVEFVELYNAGDAAVDLSGWFFSDGIDYTFPQGTTLAAGGYVVVAQNPTAVAAKFGVASLGPYSGKLSNFGETVTLRDAAGVKRDEVDYQLGFPWPTVGNAPGYSIELIHPALDNDLAGSWRASTGGDVNPDPGSDTFVFSGSNWKYFKGIAEPSATPGQWRQIGFNDSAWLTGAASIGYGDGHVVTTLSDMQGTYSTVYLRQSFNIADASQVGGLRLEAQFDDGVNVWINGTHVLRENVLNVEMPYTGTAVDAVEDTTFRAFNLTNPSAYLVDGENVIAVQLFNASLSGSSDAWFDARLVETAGGPSGGAGPTPGRINSMFAENAAPQMRQVNHTPEMPASGQDVLITIKATDPEGVASVTLDYQLVDPGSYIRLTDPAYQTNWTTVAMHDDGLNGDAVAGDDIYSVVMPAALQINRRLVRYRITSTDTLGATIRGPYADDPQPNFAYYVYDGVPDWTGSLQPGVQPNVTYSSEALSTVAVYQLIADGTDVINSQYNGSFNLQQFRGTFVYDGVVYDHIEYRNRGRASTYQVGKNKWKINFTRGHGLEARDNYGKKYDVPLDKINILPGTNPWWRNNVSTEGTVLFEPVSFKLYELAGTPSPNTNFFHFRVVDQANEVSATGDQYDGDFWGLYISIEQPEGEFLRERELPDGNIFNMHGVGGATQRTQGSLLPADKSDLSAFVNGYKTSQPLSWWEDNLDFDSYFAWNAINRAANNSDIRPEENVNYYHNQEDGKWYIIPWDNDLTFEDAPHLGRPPANFDDIDNVLSQHPSVRQLYQNFVRELQDLLFDSGDARRIVEEYANFLEPGFAQGMQIDDTIVEANQAMWDYHPRKNKKGIWYANFNPTLLPNRTFDDLVAYMQDFMEAGGYGYNLMTSEAVDAAIPNRPTISYTGTAGFPVNRLKFQTSPFSDPQGAQSFAAMEWRVAEVRNSETSNYDPTKRYIYEIEGGWESGELATFDTEISVPALAVEPGNTYRARVRMKDDTGKWSHWSAPIEFVASPAVPTDVFRYLRISELHYHPDTNVDSEFIEFTNTSDTVTLDLTGVTIPNGPSSTFVFAAGTTLAPGGYLVVVQDQAAFSATYPHVDPSRIAGQYAGALSNGGETIEVIDAEGGIVHDFRYEDGNGVGEESWHPTTDGLGYSLVIVDARGDQSGWGDGTRWRPSFEVGGSPGAADRMLGDFDGDNDVDLRDVVFLQGRIGTPSGATALTGDLTGDGAVDRKDVARLMRSYGRSYTPPSASPAPAPASALVTTRLDREPRDAAMAFAANRVRARRVVAAATDHALATTDLEPSVRDSVRLRAVRVHRAARGAVASSGR